VTPHVPPKENNPGRAGVAAPRLRLFGQQTQTSLLRCAPHIGFLAAPAITT
jgi:hypothetical protein